MNSKTKENTRFILFLLVLLICGALAIFCAMLGLDLYLENTVEPTGSELLVSSMGEFITEEHYSYGWWQDSGRYSKYTYKSADLNNEYLSPIEESDIRDIYLRVSDFLHYVYASENSEYEEDKSLYENYDFLLSTIDTNDYWFIEYGEIDTRDFEMFIFDTETKVLYRFSYSI